jgi:beta-xylosidase
VTRWPKPALPAQPAAAAPSSDEFDGDALGLQWQWQANPDSSGWSLTDRPGSLRLFTQALPEGAGNLWPVAALLLQKPPSETFQVTTELAFDPQRPGERAGLLVFGTDYAWVGVEQKPAGRAVVVKTSLGASEETPEEEAASLPAPLGPVHLRVEWRSGGLCRFAVSFDGRNFTTFGSTFAARPGRWVGAKVGLFAAATSGQAGRTPRRLRLAARHPPPMSTEIGVGIFGAGRQDSRHSCKTGPRQRESIAAAASNLVLADSGPRHDRMLRTALPLAQPRPPPEA